MQEYDGATSNAFNDYYLIFRDGAFQLAPLEYSINAKYKRHASGEKLVAEEDQDLLNLERDLLTGIE